MDYGYILKVILRKGGGAWPRAYNKYQTMVKTEKYKFKENYGA